MWRPPAPRPIRTEATDVEFLVQAKALRPWVHALVLAGVGRHSHLSWRPSGEFQARPRPLRGPQARTACRRDSGLDPHRSEEHTSELQSLMLLSYAVLCLKKKNSLNNLP